jgi:hypothetical protein
MWNLQIGMNLIIELLLKGDTLADHENSVIFRAVQEYIKEKERFG